MASKTPPHEASRQVALTPDGIHVSPLDERQYKYLILPNGLHALVVSDPETQSSSAAMDVHVGYHSDPEDLPGLAHFCEHMLFLGTEKYPDENSYSAFLTSHGGSSNAFTSARNTNYYFDVGTAHLHEALDRFAQFFLTPRFTASATDREMHAVDSENKNYLQDDYWRINQAHRSLGNPRHPYHKFGVGNLETLRDTPTKNQRDVRQALLEYYDAYYSANVMKLVVYGKDDVAVLEQWVTDIFSGIRNTGRSGPPDFQGESPFTDDHLGRVLKVVPVKDLNIIGVTWLLPPLRGPHYTQQQTAMIAHLIGHEGEGSLLSLLKSKNWVTTISAGVEEEHAEFALFLVNFDATEDGIAHVEEIVSSLFQYLRLLRECLPFEAWMFAEMEDLAVMHFLFQSKQPPIHFTSGVAANMQTLPTRDILSQDALFFPEENAQIADLLAMMTPTRMRLLVVTKSVEADADNAERWYGTKFCEHAIASDVVAKWTTVELPRDDELALPVPNAFVASDFTLIDRSDASVVGSLALTAPPRRIRDDATARVWFKPDGYFQKPRTHVALAFYSPTVNDSALAYVLSDLVVACVEDELTESTYDAALAGMHYDLAVQGNSFHLGAVGFSAKLPVLVLCIVEAIHALATTLSDEVFGRVHQQARRAYENMKLDEAYRLAMHATSAVMHESGAYTTDELVAAIGMVENDPALVMRHAQRMLDHVYLEALVYGNLYEHDALALVESVLTRLPDSRPVVASQHTKWLPRHLQLPVGADCVLRRVHPNADNLNCALDVVFQLGEETMALRVVLAVFAQLVSEPLFHQLRTQEQLGYTVFSTPSRQSGVQCFRVILQSNVASPEYLDQRLEAFLTGIRAFIAWEMTDAQLDKYIQAIVKDYTEAPKSQEDHVNALCHEIAIREYNFDRRLRLAKLVTTVTRQDLLRFVDEYIAVEGKHRRRLSTRIYGSPFPIVTLEKAQPPAFSVAAQTALAAASALLPAASSSPSNATPPTPIVIEDIAQFKQQQAFYGLRAAAATR